MPGFDRTGPFGTGSMTGGARGLCNPAAAGYRLPSFGFVGFGRGMGLGRGFRGGMGREMKCGFARGYRWYPLAYASPNPSVMDAADELEILRVQADSFKSSLDAINKRIAELEKSS